MKTAFQFGHRREASAMIEMTVESIRVSLVTQHRVVILKERDSERYLPIWIGPHEADAIALELQQVSVARPLTHDLLKSVIAELGGKVSRILVNDLHDDTFYARIVVDIDGRSTEIDSRPSDAIALAVRVKAPIFVEESVLEKAGVTLDGEKEDGEDASLTSADSEKLAVFRDFINSLDLDDFGKPKSDS
jgi:uncharacterized protein